MKASGKEQTYYALVLFPGVVVILILKIFYSIWLWMVQREPILMAKSHGGASLKPAGGMADAVIRIGSRGRCITRHQLCSRAGRMQPGSASDPGVLLPTWEHSCSAPGPPLLDLGRGSDCSVLRATQSLTHYHWDLGCPLSHGCRRWHCAHCVVPHVSVHVENMDLC